MARLPIYFLVDCSGTMHGERLTQVKRRITEICGALQGDPRARRSAHVAVIWFNDHAYQTPLVPIGLFVLSPDMRAIGKTKLGEGLLMLNDALDHDLAPDDYRPLVFFMTDGLPTDEWRDEAARYRSRSSHVPLRTIGFAVGSDADERLIREVADVVLRFEDDFVQNIGQYLDWSGG